MPVSIIIEDARWRRAFPRPVSLVKQACIAALRSARNDGDISILLANDDTLRSLNHDFRGKDKPTNVLSFPQGEAGYLGDVALSYDTILREALAQGKPVAHHTAHMVVHGVLHLLGYDHEEEADAERMERLEIRILKGLSVPNPYRVLTE